MNLTPDVEFHEDIRLLIWRPRGLLTNRLAFMKFDYTSGGFTNKTDLNGPYIETGINF